MAPNSIISLITFSLFLILHFFYTQKIYFRSIFFILIVISLLLPIGFFFLSKEKDKLFAVNFGLLIFYYMLLLWLIKICYKRLNQFLINKNLINMKFREKDFTYIISDGDIIETWWDKSAEPPSWLDYFFTILLFVLPLLLTIIFA